MTMLRIDTACPSLTVDVAGRVPIVDVQAQAHSALDPRASAAVVAVAGPPLSVECAADGGAKLPSMQLGAPVVAMAGSPPSVECAVDGGVTPPSAPTEGTPELVTDGNEVVTIDGSAVYVLVPVSGGDHA